MEDKSYILVDKAAAFARALGHISSFSSLALDMEMENNFHHYGLHVALIQISTPDGANYVIDALADLELSPLGRVLSDPAVGLILHDSDFDRRVCNKIYGWRLSNMFDTKVAAQLCGIRQFGLGALLESFFGVKTNKRFQRLDWLRRPLREDALEYASTDTRHLFELRRVLSERLQAAGRMEWLLEECARQQQDIGWHDTGPLHYRIKGSHKLPGRQLAILAALVEFRDDFARRMDKSMWLLIPDRILLSWAVKPPSSLKALKGVPGLPRALYKNGESAALFRAIERGKKAGEEIHPKNKKAKTRQPVAGFDARVHALQKWRAEKAGALDLEPFLIMPNDIIQFKARYPGVPYPPDVLGQLREWQRKLFWDDFEALLPLRHVEDR